MWRGYSRGVKQSGSRYLGRQVGVVGEGEEVLLGCGWTRKKEGTENVVGARPQGRELKRPSRGRGHG